MELDIYLFVILPAVVALTLKAGLFIYAYFSDTKNQQTRLYLSLLAILFIQNVALIPGYISISQGIVPYTDATIFYLTEIVALAVLFHLAISLTFAKHSRARHVVRAVIYPSALMLGYLLLYTPLLISGYENQNYVVTRIPGPLYPLLELYAVATVLGTVGVLLYGANFQNTAQNRLKNSTLLVAILPMAIAILAVLALLNFGATWLNVSSLQPLLTTYFLIVTAYATHKSRLFDIQFYIPWSNVRKRKTAFYHRIHTLVAEIADLASPKEVIDRLASTLGCPVALVGTDKPALALAGGSRFMAEMPKEMLRRFDHIVVANEIADSFPDYHNMMQRHGVAAVVPFHPHSQHAAGWLLLGDSFSEHVYTKLDFKVVEQLFDKMADLFLDKLLTMRTQLAEASRSIRNLQNQRQDLTASLTMLQQQNDILQKQNQLLRKERPIDSLATFTNAGAEELISNERFAVTITLLGRDKVMLKQLRSSFSQVQSYVGVESTGFRRQAPADVVIAFIDSGDTKAHAKLSEFLARHRGEMAALLYGPAAHDFAAANRSALLGGLIEVMPEDYTAEMLARQVRALAALQQAVHAIPDADEPLVGQSQVFVEQMAAARRLAGFKDPLLVKASDLGQAVALATHIHALSGRQGRLHILRPESNSDGPPSLADLAAEARSGSVIIPGMRLQPKEMHEELLDTLGNIGDVRLIAVCDDVPSEDSQAFGERFKPFIVEMPSLRERKLDIPLMIHYFTLQFNLQGGTHLYLNQSEVDDLLASAYPDDVAGLKRLVFTQLSSRFRGSPQASSAQNRIDTQATDKSLDDYVAELEARIITQTLERCGGNKSKAARLLGLRPNTLHYKLERYGIGGSKSN